MHRVVNSPPTKTISWIHTGQDTLWLIMMEYILNFLVASISKLCKCPLNVLMGFYLLEIVSYTCKLHYLSLVRPMINLKYWCCEFGKCMISTKNSQKRAWLYTKKTKIFKQIQLMSLWFTCGKCKNKSMSCGTPMGFDHSANLSWHGFHQLIIPFLWKIHPFLG